MDISLSTLLGWLNTGGVIGLLAFALVGIYKRWWVMGWAYEDLQEKWKETVSITEKAQENADRAVQEASRALDLAERFHTGESPPPREPRRPRNR